MKADIIPLRRPNIDRLRDALDDLAHAQATVAAHMAAIEELAPLVWAEMHPNQRRFLKMGLPEVKAMVRRG